MKRTTLLASLSLLFWLLAACATFENSTQEPKQDKQEVVEEAIPQFTWPVVDGEITDLFGKKRHRGRVHKGLDMAGRKNTPIYAAEDGKVVWRGRGRGYGHYVVIKHNDTWSTRYAHLNAYKVRWSQKVKKGQLIGLMGRSGRASGTHLHFEIRKNKVTVNPILFLPTPTAKISANIHKTSLSPDSTGSIKEAQSFRTAYLNGPIVWLF